MTKTRRRAPPFVWRYKPRSLSAMDAPWYDYFAAMRSDLHLLLLDIAWITGRTLRRRKGRLGSERDQMTKWTPLGMQRLEPMRTGVETLVCLVVFNFYFLFSSIDDSAHHGLADNGCHYHDVLSARYVCWLVGRCGRGWLTLAFPRLLLHCRVAARPSQSYPGLDPSCCHSSLSLVFQTLTPNPATWPARYLPLAFHASLAI